MEGMFNIPINNSTATPAIITEALLINDLILLLIFLIY